MHRVDSKETSTLVCVCVCVRGKERERGSGKGRREGLEPRASSLMIALHSIWNWRRHEAGYWTDWPTS